MKKYFYIVKNTFSSNFIYRTDTAFNVIAGILTIYIEISIWNALYGTRSVVYTSGISVTINDMINYVIVSHFLALVMGNSAIRRISSRVQSGQIAVELLRPLSFKGLIIAEVLAGNLYGLVFFFVPILTFGLVFYEIATVPSDSILFFSIAVINAIVLNYLIAYCLGLLSFWYVQVWQLSFLLDGFLRLFGGAWVPIWFFPKWLHTISAFLPFQLIYYFPLSIYTGKLNHMDIIVLLIQQLAWIIGLICVERMLWHRGTQKLVIQGG